MKLLTVVFLPTIIVLTCLLLLISPFLRRVMSGNGLQSSVSAPIIFEKILGNRFQKPLEKTIEETTTAARSTHDQFWLNSGGMFYIEGNTGHSIIGNLPALSKWRLIYAKSNPIDTDNGYHPQNILRLVTNVKLKDQRQEVYVRILNVNESESYNRNVSNGIFMMGRYKNGDNLYYAGIRVDGTAVIKRKSSGEYITLAQVPVFNSEKRWNRYSESNLIPENVWLGIRSTIQTKNGSPYITLWLDKNSTGEWKKILDVYDYDNSYGGPIYSAGYGGIRTDFMDVEFKDYIFSEPT